MIQTQGRKRWKVYSPPDCAVKLNVDPFCRGKGEDELSIPILSDEGSKLLLDVMLVPGDILFVPARFPHTTDTLNCYDENYGGDDNRHGSDKEKKSSMHLTLGLDTHVWAMNYMSMRTLALRRFDIHDVLESNDLKDYFDRNMDECVGRVNQLSYDLREGLFSSLDSISDESLILILEQNRALSIMLATNLLNFHDRVNDECGWADTNGKHNSLTLDHCLETVTHFQTIGRKISNSHEDMYITALEEERMRNIEGKGWAINVKDIMVKERADRLSIFRVPVFFEQLDKLREELRVWGDRPGSYPTSFPIILNGDHVEVNILVTDAVGNVHAGIKSSWSPAKIVKVRSDGLFNLQLFDGDVKEGLNRRDIKGPHGLGVFI